MTMRALHMLGNLLSRSPAEDPSSAISLPELEPIALPGPWSHGVALGMHSQDDQSPDEGRTQAGILLSRFKYAGHRQLARPLGDALAQAVRAHRPEVVVHIPSTRRNTFEPACELARSAARALRVSCLPHFIAFTRKIRPQKDLTSLSEKRENVRGAFKVRRPDLVKGHRVLIVDDVFDSGATLEEAWRAVREAGASEITVAAVTRTRFQRADW